MKKFLFACMVLASVFVLAGCSPQPPADQEAKAYIRKVLTDRGSEFLKEKFDNDVSSDSIYKVVDIVSISDGVRESQYYDSPALLYCVSIKYHKYAPAYEGKYMDWGESTCDLYLAVIKDKKTEKLSLTEKYTGENSRRW